MTGWLDLFGRAALIVGAGTLGWTAAAFVLRLGLALRVSGSIGASGGLALALLIHSVRSESAEMFAFVLIIGVFVIALAMLAALPVCFLLENRFGARLR